jgi:glyoxylase-like metal-dependent hydrolase (beta-lactamase superfamily II)
LALVTGLSNLDSGESHMPFATAHWPPGLFHVRGIMSVPHVLVDADGAVLLDTGFPGDAKRIRRRMAEAGVGPKDVRAILLTHGHIDHAGNLVELKAWTGAPVYGHPLEQQHIDGVFPYTGFARVCGALEAAGRAVTRYKAGKIDVPIAEGDTLPFWGGLRVVHLPGHTLGHCGFYSDKFDLLFSGDLWVRFLMRTQASPAIFSDDLSLVPGSMRKARAIGAHWIVPGHYDVPDATRLRQRFEELCEGLERRSPVI